MLTPGVTAQPTAAPIFYAGKTVLVTGSTDGLGREIARALAVQDAHVIVHGRNAERGLALVDEITKSGKGSAIFLAADFSSLKAVHDFADTIAKKYPKLDLLVNNAGVDAGRQPRQTSASLKAVRDFAATIAKKYPKLDLLVNNAGVAIAGRQPRQTSADGHELRFAVNYLAGWVLVNRLRPNLAAAAPSRIVNVASGSANAIDFDDVMLERPGAHRRGYGQSKLAQVSMTVELAPSFAKQGITMIALHPATMMDTTMVRGLGAAPMTSVEEGRDHVMSLITAPALEAGAFYVHGRPSRAADPQPYDAAARKRLAALSAQLTGVAAQ